MKKRRSIIIAFILAAVLVMGVGYAALNDTLDITGTADVNASAAEEAFNEDVYFSEVSTGDGYTANINVNNNDKAQYTVTGLKGQNDSVTMTFTIKNGGDLDASVKILNAPTNTNTEYFEVTYSWANTDTVTLVAGAETTIDVTVKLLKTPQAAISGTFGIELQATSVETTAQS